MAKKERYYLGNPNLPTAQIEYEYTPDMLRKMKRSKKDLLYFAETFFFIIDPDDGRQKIKLFDYQQRCLKTMTNHRKVILLASRQIGKALDVDTPVPSPSGWKTMGTLQDGDVIFDSKGRHCNVVKAHDILYDRDCYEVVFDNGEKIIADGDHLWTTKSRIGTSTLTTVDILNTLHKKGSIEPNHKIPLSLQGVEYNAQDLPIDPYTLGLWLGNGEKAGSIIAVGKRDLVETVQNIKMQGQFDKVIIGTQDNRVFSVRPTVLNEVKTKSLSTLLKMQNLQYNKHIPLQYMQSSREQRINILSGLIDSDGWITNGIANFGNSNIQLVRDFKELVESLGYKGNYREIEYEYNGELKPWAVVTFKPREYVSKLSFKRSKIKIEDVSENDNSKRAQWHYIKEVNKVDSRPVRCITVDSEDSLYLIGKQFIPTHNTTLMTIYALWVACFEKDKNIVIVANKESTAKEIYKRIQMAYTELPSWLKPGIQNWGQTGAEFANGSRIWISTTTGSSARGTTINCLILDELAFIEPESILEEFWRSVYPTISRAKTSKVLIASTPNGTGNLFHRLVEQAQDEDSEFQLETVMWDEIPGRDEDFMKTQIAELGSIDSFEQEYCCSTGNTLIDISIGNELRTMCISEAYESM